jgi:electron transport complex protein RnfE
MAGRRGPIQVGGRNDTPAGNPEREVQSEQPRKGIEIVGRRRSSENTGAGEALGAGGAAGTVSAVGAAVGDKEVGGSRSASPFSSQPKNKIEIRKSRLQADSAEEESAQEEKEQVQKTAQEQPEQKPEVEAESLSAPEAEAEAEVEVETEVEVEAEVESEVEAVAEVEVEVEPTVEAELPSATEIEAEATVEAEEVEPKVDDIGADVSAVMEVFAAAAIEDTPVEEAPTDDTSAEEDTVDETPAEEDEQQEQYEEQYEEEQTSDDTSDTSSTDSAAGDASAALPTAPPAKDGAFASFGKLLKKNIVMENPVLRLVLGTCPTLAVTTQASNAIGMGVAATIVLICSNAVISALRNVIPNKVRIPAYITIIAGFVTMVQMLVKAFTPEIDSALGIFLPLIVVNCIILGRAEMFARDNKVLPSMLDGLTMGIGFTAALLCMGIIREVFGAGTLFGVPLPLLSEGSWIGPISVFAMAPGGFFVFGILMAVANKLSRDRNLPVKNSPCDSCPAAAGCSKIEKGGCEAK